MPSLIETGYVMHFVDLAAQQSLIKDTLDQRIGHVLAHGKYIMGPEVKELEASLCAFSAAKHCLSCANGTDALQLALMALDIKAGECVFVPSFTFASTAEIVPFLGAIPVFVDVDPMSFNMDASSLKRSIMHAKEIGLTPKAVIAVDLFGLTADYDVLTPIAREENMYVIADSAQAFGAEYKGQKAGTLADITSISFFPSKPLGCYGDGGALLTDNDEWAALIDSYRVHGKGTEKYDNIRIGMNSRLDTLQAAILLAKLSVYADEIVKRNVLASEYHAALSPYIETPIVPPGHKSVWAQYTIKAKDQNARDKMVRDLKKNNIPAMVYYPKPLHKQSAYKNFPTDPQGCRCSGLLSETVFSLPMHPYLEQHDRVHVIETVKESL
jgi:dTDP-4-amino-4,6-dideoxygalactose transaminase